MLGLFLNIEHDVYCNSWILILGVASIVYWVVGMLGGATVAPGAVLAWLGSRRSVACSDGEKACFVGYCRWCLRGFEFARTCRK